MYITNGRVFGGTPSILIFWLFLDNLSSSEQTIDRALKHKDSFGKSENLSKIFFAEILVFDHDYEGKSSSSNGLL